MSESTWALLIVDDNEDNRYTLMRRLQRQGYTNLTSAVDGRQALDLLEAQHFDLVLLDIMMPVLNGYEVLERMRADHRLRHIPVIMISALDEMDSVIRCIELGAEDYLAKPFNPTLLRARVGASLEKKRLRDELVQHARRMERELEAARAVQLSMVPVDFPPPMTEQPFSVHATLQPAHEVGGDLYDCFWIQPGRLCLLVADVSDKGAAAALFMARAKTTFRLLAMRLAQNPGRALSPAELVSSANEELCCDNPMGMFVTLFLLIVDTRTGALEWCNAGHTLPYRLGPTGGVSALPQGRSIPVGVRPAMALATGTLQLSPGEGLFIYTDGITEATNLAAEFFGDQRLEAALAAGAGTEPEVLLAGVLQAVRDFAAGAPPADDIAAMACRWCATTVNATFTDAPDEFARAQQVLADFGASNGLSEGVLFALNLALDEIVSNIIKYAYPNQAGNEIWLQLSVDRAMVALQIEDDGVPFDPLGLPAPDLNAPLATREPGGLGVHLVRRLLDEVVYARVANRNRLILRKSLSGRGETQSGNIAS